MKIVRVCLLKKQERQKVPGRQKVNRTSNVHLSRGIKSISFATVVAAVDDNKIRNGLEKIEMPRDRFR